MSTQELFQGFDDETQARYEQEASELYGAETGAGVEPARKSGEGQGLHYGRRRPDLSRPCSTDPADADVHDGPMAQHQHYAL